MRNLIAGSGVAVCCVATGCRYADPAAAGKHVADTHTYIDLAADVGCTRLRVFGGPLPKDMERERAVEQVADSLRSVADHAQQRGVTLCFETHDAWTEPTHVADVMQRVNHPAVAVNWDIMHPILFGKSTMDDAFETLRPWIRHVHVHDGVLEEGKLILEPIGEGAIDHRRAIELLTAMKYDGYLSGEWINWQPPADHLPRELAALKDYEKVSK